WIYAGSLVYPYQGGRVPLLSYGATIGLPIITFSIGNYWDRYYRGRPWYRNRSYWVRRPPPVHVRSPHYDRPQARPAPPRIREQNDSRRKVYPPPVNHNRAPEARPNRPGPRAPEAAHPNNPRRGSEAPRGGNREPRGNGGNPPKRKDSEG
ncbi:MAG: SH3 domain-containing protein, partial [Casimicrobiaceae bacterium]